MNIQTDRLSLSLMDESCRDDFFRLYQCPKIMRHIGEPCSDEYLSRTFRNALKWNEHASLNQKVWQIVDKRNEDFIGITLVKQSKSQPRSFEIGILLDTDKTKRGFAVETLSSLFDNLHRSNHASDFLGIVSAGNIESSMMLKRLGFSMQQDAGDYFVYSLKLN